MEISEQSLVVRDMIRTQIEPLDNPYDDDAVPGDSAPKKATGSSLKLKFSQHTEKIPVVDLDPVKSKKTDTNLIQFFFHVQRFT